MILYTGVGGGVKGFVCIYFSSLSNRLHKSVLVMKFFLFTLFKYINNMHHFHTHDSHILW